jgi:hypothetical protein
MRILPGLFLVVGLAIVSASEALAQNTNKVEYSTPYKPAPEDEIDDWIVLSNDEWRIEGEHEFVDGILVLGGAKTTRAYLNRKLYRRFDLRFQYRSEGKNPAGMGWEGKRGDQRITYGTYFTLNPQKDWRDWFLQEFFDINHPFQRIVHYPTGANGVFDDVETVWIEVPAGNRLFVRNVRLGYHQSSWQWMLAIPPVLCVVVGLCFYWRRKKKSERKNATPPQAK